MKEYGGYLEFEYFKGAEYHEGGIALNSGRHCLEYLIKAKKIKKLCIPYFLCDSVKEVCEKLQVKIEYYHIDIRFMPICDRVFKDDEWIYIVNYYGQIDNNMLRTLKLKYENIVIDNVQAFFQKPIEEVDTIYSCRKFFGVADGAYLYTNTFLNEDLKYDNSFNRMDFLFGRLEKNAEEFYPKYVANNKMFASECMKKMSLTTKNILKGLDYQCIQETRTNNFKYLHEKLGSINRLNLTVAEGAFMYPLYLDEGPNIRFQLQQKKIYIPILWPNVEQICHEDDLENIMAQNILPLPVDQRYDLQDMKYIENQIKILYS